MPAPKRRGRPRKEESAAKNTSENKKTTAKSATAKKTTAKKPSASAKKTLKPQGDTVFALDIGTRTVVGILGFMDGETFRVTDTESVPHLKRAMIDGQVEDIEQVAKVARTVKETLEQRNSIRLTEVSIAAAGRALKTYRLVYLSLIPTFALLAIFYYFPIGFGFAISFTDYLPGDHMFFVGFEYVFIGSMLTRQVHQTGEVGLMMSLFCIVEMVMSTPFGLLLDRIGNVASFLLSTVLEMAALITFWYSNKSQGGLFYLAFIFLSLSDSSYETVIPTIIGRNYSDQESANSTYRLFQYMGGCICYLIAPLFVDGDTKYVSDASLMRELTLCGVLCILSAICFVVYEKRFKKELPVVSKEPAHPDEKAAELVHVANEDLDEVSKAGAKKVATVKMDDVKVTAVNNEDFTH